MWTYRAQGQGIQSDRQSSDGQWWLRTCRSWRDERGTTAIEFAIIAIPLFYFIFGIIEFALAMTVSNSLEAATNLSSRVGKTGYVDIQALKTQEQTIMDEVERRVGPLIDVTKLRMTHKVYNDFQSLTLPDILDDKNGDGDTDDPGEWTDVDGDGFKDGSDGVGESGNLVVYRITYPWEIFTPLIGQFAKNGVINLAAYSVVKNEPY